MDIWFSNVMILLNSNKRVRALHLGEFVRKNGFQTICTEWANDKNSHLILCPISASASLISATIIFDKTISSLQFNINLYGRNNDTFEKIALWHSRPTLVMESMYINPNSWIRTLSEFCDQNASDSTIWSKYKNDEKLYLGLECTSTEMFDALTVKTYFEYIEISNKGLSANGLFA